MDLFSFLNKRVSIEFNDGDVLEGKVVHHTVAGDNDPEEESITFIPETGAMKNQEAEVYEHEVKTVREI
ncbi:hypothetical protein C5Z25_12115 [Lactobacillus sp. CBA3605]|uniref:hypothetical protein n=1 Tax=Lactobacillus sp. CBA3605 TaxID=2099788 RepID=UPI000CFB0234|nr:hypothetical protein [Lactobacillus sp. CBA3605]AVK62456.1 hypothetical protein C5Z25_12115 [Lactobacillus sp. CBA3605]